MAYFILIADGFDSCTDFDCPEHGARNRAQAGYVDTPQGNRLMQVGELEVVADVQGELATADTVRPPALLPEPKPADPTVPAPRQPYEPAVGMRAYSRHTPHTGTIAAVRDGLPRSRGLVYDIEWDDGAGTDTNLVRDDFAMPYEWFTSSERSAKFRAVYNDIEPFVARHRELATRRPVLGGAAHELYNGITETLARHGLGRESYKKLLGEATISAFDAAEDIDQVELAAGTWP